MKKKTFYTVLVTGLLVASLSISNVIAQSRWELIADFQKNFAGCGGFVSTFIYDIGGNNTSLDLYGMQQRTRTYRPNGTIAFQSTDSFATRINLTNLQISSPGKIRFTDCWSNLSSFISINGEEYVTSFKDSVSIMVHNVFKRNTLTNNFESLGPKTSSGVEGMAPLNAGNFFIWGYFFSGLDNGTIREFRGGGIWNSINNSFTPAPLNLSYGFTSKSEDKKIVFIVSSDGGRWKIFRTGEVFQWIENQWSMPANQLGSLEALYVVNENEAYGVWRQDIVGYPRDIYRFSKTSQQYLGRISKSDGNHPTDARVNSIHFKNGQLYIATNSDRFNGEPINGIFTLNVSSVPARITSILPAPPSSIERSTLFFVGDSIYLLERKSSIILGIQKLYVLRGGTVTSVRDIAVEKTVSLFPNPVTSGNVTVKNATGLVSIYSVDGKKFPLPQTVFSEQTTLNLSFLPSGMYILELRNKKRQSEFVKVLKQ